MAHPLATKAILASRVKHDAVDAKTLAHLLRTNLLAEAWIAPPKAREARRLVCTRAGLVRMRSRVHPHATRIVARAWLRVIWACWHTDTPYDPQAHLAEQRLDVA